MFFNDSSFQGYPISRKHFCQCRESFPIGGAFPSRQKLDSMGISVCDSKLYTGNPRRTERSGPREKQEASSKKLRIYLTQSYFSAAPISLKIYTFYVALHYMHTEYSKGSAKDESVKQP